jgi:hypothetical protein
MLEMAGKIILNRLQIAALARAAAAALEEAAAEGRLPAGAVFAVRAVGTAEDATLRVVLEAVERLLVINAYRLAWTLRPAGAPLTKAPGRCRPLLTREADALLDAAYRIVEPYAAGLIRLEAKVAEALIEDQTQKMAARLLRRLPASA